MKIQILYQFNNLFKKFFYNKIKKYLCNFIIIKSNFDLFKIFIDDI